MIWMEHVACMGERNEYMILLENLKWERHIGRPRHGWKHDIKMDLKEIGYQAVDYVYQVYIRGQWWACVNLVTNRWVP
jgi:hypothetical protein